MREDIPGEVLAVSGVGAVDGGMREMGVAERGEGAGGCGADGVEGKILGGGDCCFFYRRIV